MIQNAAIFIAIVTILLVVFWRYFIYARELGWLWDIGYVAALVGSAFYFYDPDGGAIPGTDGVPNWVTLVPPVLSALIVIWWRRRLPSGVEPAQFQKQVDDSVAMHRYADEAVAKFQNDKGAPLTEEEEADVRAAAISVYNDKRLGRL